MSFDAIPDLPISSKSKSPRIVHVEYKDEWHDDDDDAEKNDETEKAFTMYKKSKASELSTKEMEEIREGILSDFVAKKAAKERGEDHESKLRKEFEHVEYRVIRRVKRALLRDIRKGRKLRKASGRRRRPMRGLSKEDQLQKVRDEVLSDVKRGHRHRLRKTEHGRKHSRRPKHFGLDENGKVVKIRIKKRGGNSSTSSSASVNVDQEKLRLKEQELRRREQELARKEKKMLKAAAIREREEKLLQRKQELAERQRKLEERSKKLKEKVAKK